MPKAALYFRDYWRFKCPLYSGSGHSAFAVKTRVKRTINERTLLGIAVWNSVEQNPAYADIIAVLQEQVGTAAADALRLPFCLGNPDEVTTVLSNSGFTSINVETTVESAQFPSSRHMVEAELRGWLPLFDINLSEAKIDSVLIESDSTLSKYANSSNKAIFPTSAHVITARRS